MPHSGHVTALQDILAEGVPAAYLAFLGHLTNVLSGNLFVLTPYSNGGHTGISPVAGGSCEFIVLPDSCD